MNVVNAGSRFQIYGEDVKTYKRLPTMSFEVSFNKMTGFFLVSRPDLSINEEKIYGNHEEKVNKVIKSYKCSTRNFGIILSGQKGIGKSLFARVLAAKAIENGLPVIIVNEYIPGIANFLSSIEQEVVVIFDEFEKTFGEVEHSDPQEEMLSLFDGLDNGKKLFVITCNETRKLNEYLLNRPGRFHYHFMINYPTENEIREYLKDKLLPDYYEVINSIVNFSRTINMTYDYLRAIVFEINQGYSLEETLNDLNITQSSSVTFNMTVTLTSGKVYTTYGRHIDLAETSYEWYDAYDTKSDNKLRFAIIPSKITFRDGQLYINGENTKIYVDPDDYWQIEDEDERKAVIKKAESQSIKEVTFQKNTPDFTMKYLV